MMVVQPRGRGGGHGVAAPARLRLMSAAASLVTLLLPPVASVAGSATAASTISLDGTWALSSDAGHRLNGVVPGDLITDLENARIVQDPLYELGWLNNNTNLAPPWTAHVLDAERPPYRIDYAWSRAPAAVGGRRLVPLAAFVELDSGEASDHQPLVVDFEAVAFDAGE